MQRYEKERFVASIKRIILLIATIINYIFVASSYLLTVVCI